LKESQTDQVVTALKWLISSGDMAKPTAYAKSFLKGNMHFSLTLRTVVQAHLVTILMFVMNAAT